MSSTLTSQQAATATDPKRPDLGIVDTDIHPSPARPDSVLRFLPKRWRTYAEQYGTRTQHGLATGPAWKPLWRGGCRSDAWPDDGPPGSSLELMRSQLLDAHGITEGLLNPLDVVAAQLNQDYGAALARACNEWMLETFVDPEPRLRLSIVIPYEDPEASVREIERWADHPAAAQILMLSRSYEPFGRRRYWPIYAAAEQAGLPIGIHLSEIGGHPNTPNGFSSYYPEYHAAHVLPFQTHLLSMIFDGAFDRFPGLRVVFIEGGLAWAPALMQRVGHLWARTSGELPDLQRDPTEYVRDHVWFATQPIDEPENPRHLTAVLRELGTENVVFSTDYPHWDFDNPARVLPKDLTADERDGILGGNARRVFRLRERG